MEKKKKYLIGVAIGALLIALATLTAIYCRVASFYGNHFLPGTVINGFDCSKLQVSDIALMVRANSAKYVLEIMGRDPKTCEGGTTLLQITADEIGLKNVDLEKNLQEILEQQNRWLWIKAVFETQDPINKDFKITYDREQLFDILRNNKAFQRKNMTTPENAYIGEYDERESAFAVVPDTKGSRLNTDKARTCILEAIENRETSVDLDELDCYKSARITADNKRLNGNLEKANLWLSTKITYDWNENEVILDREQLKDWIRIENDQPILDTDAVYEFVKENASEYDTYGKKRKFVTTAGAELTLSSGAYGWKTDRKAETEELIALIYGGTVEEREPIYSMQAAQKGSNDIGNSYVEADLGHQHLYLYQDGEIVLESDFVSGNVSRGNTTPPGVFGITYKTTDAVLRGDNYETPVKYWMPFNGNIGMHDATWRASFGGDIYLTSGSHGCINLPYSKAKEIYQYVSKGFPVICYY